MLAAAGSAIDLNGLILTQSDYAPTGQSPLFADADDVSAYFGPQSVEAAMATTYFNGFQNCTKTPGQLNFARYAGTAVSAWAVGASLASMTLAQPLARSNRRYQHDGQRCRVHR